MEYNVMSVFSSQGDASFFSLKNPKVEIEVCRILENTVEKNIFYIPLLLLEIYDSNIFISFILKFDHSL